MFHRAITEGRVSSICYITVYTITYKSECEQRNINKTDSKKENVNTMYTL